MHSKNVAVVQRRLYFQDIELIGWWVSGVGEMRESSMDDDIMMYIMWVFSHAQG